MPKRPAERPYTTIDFETQAFIDGSGAPPEPVGVAIRRPDRPAEYFAWGHPTGNNCKRSDAQRALRTVWRDPILCHNTAFDFAVARDHLALPLPQTYGDSLWAAFFHDPYSPSLRLKPLAERHLGQPPDEADAVRDWLVANKVVPQTATSSWGAHIAKAPGDLVGVYARGDVDRTAALWDKLREPWMAEPLAREQALLPVLMEAEARGVRIDSRRLQSDLDHYENLLSRVERDIRRTLSAPTLNLDSNDELADALERGLGVKLPATPTGKRAVNKDAIASVVHGPLKGLLLYRSALDQSLKTFLRPWSGRANGIVHVHWNSVRGGSSHKQQSGARTGRLSSEPNFQNITTEQDKLIVTLRQLLGRRKIELPVVRSYIVPLSGLLLLGADYSQQELRMLAHYEDGPLAAAYRKDKQLDIHTFVQQLIKESTGVHLDRKYVKVLNFAIVYGTGLQTLSLLLGTDVDTAQRMLFAYFRALPSVKQLMDDLKTVGRSGQYITTRGGRRYFAEPAKIVKGKRRSYEYKMLNYLVQGSSADQTKQAMVNFHGASKGTASLFQLSVHDELVVAAPRDRLGLRKAANLLREAMVEALPLDVPVTVDMEYGDNWGAMNALVT
jgi:DNA polymerase-1